MTAPTALIDARSLTHRHNLNVMGSGRTTLLLVHGYGCNQAMWRSFAPPLAAHFRLVLLDLVGFGLSDFNAWRAERQGSLEGHAADLLEIAALVDDQPLVVVGHSVGATIGVLADAMAPGTFAAHAMVSPSPCFRNDGGYHGGFEGSQLEGLLAQREADMVGWSQTLAELVGGDSSWSPMTSELVASFCRSLGPAASTLARATFLGDHRQAYEQLRKPTLIVQARHDPIAPPEVGRYLHEHIPGSELRVLDTRGHAPHLTRPDECVRAVDDFLVGLEGRGLLPPSGQR